ncbi:hypothetical protein ALI144C_00505 [Actinosynnema sp. ALI-1.44]|nr:hypothetical protein ALI144C_00505 [Actinosynnema sp. ALI-1.44]
MLRDSGRFPRVSLALTPTPLDALPQLSDRLGPSVLLKREDLTGFALGGDKPRKLEYEIVHGLQSNADIIVTCGSMQSNHARLTSAAARKLGLDCAVVLSRDDYDEFQGNLLTMRLLGTDVHIVDTDDHWALEPHALRPGHRAALRRRTSPVRLPRRTRTTPQHQTRAPLGHPAAVTIAECCRAAFHEQPRPGGRARLFRWNRTASARRVSAGCHRFRYSGKHAAARGRPGRVCWMDQSVPTTEASGKTREHATEEGMLPQNEPAGSAAVQAEVETEAEAQIAVIAALVRSEGAAGGR